MILAIAAVVLCTLPLLVVPKESICVKSKMQTLTAAETEFLSQLKKHGIKLEKHNCSSAYMLWFANPEDVSEIVANSSAKYDFIYSEAHYSFNWHEVKRLPVMLTPYQDLYEHYMRSNVKSAVLDTKKTTAAKRFIEIYHWLKENN